jgi:hypothetical protein
MNPPTFIRRLGSRHGCHGQGDESRPSAQRTRGAMSGLTTTLSPDGVEDLRLLIYGELVRTGRALVRDPPPAGGRQSCSGRHAMPGVPSASRVERRTARIPQWARGRSLPHARGSHLGRHRPQLHPPTDLLLRDLRRQVAGENSASPWLRYGPRDSLASGERVVLRSPVARIPTTRARGSGDVLRRGRPARTVLGTRPITRI